MGIEEDKKKEALWRMIQDNNTYKECLEEIALSKCVCEHVNKVREVLGLDEETITMIHSKCQHVMMPVYTTTMEKSLFKSKMMESFEFVLCTRCGVRFDREGKETVLEEI